ncbi:MAG: hypothetical protein Q4F31_09565 [Eubacteriales bacterium]|nr:hypothetical protein [Eubacteriales bacterium]
MKKNKVSPGVSAFCLLMLLGVYGMAIWAGIEEIWGVGASCFVSALAAYCIAKGFPFREDETEEENIAEDNDTYDHARSRYYNTLHSKGLDNPKASYSRSSFTKQEDEDTMLGYNFVSSEDMQLLEESGYDADELEYMDGPELREAMEDAGVGTDMYDFDF